MEWNKLEKDNVEVDYNEVLVHIYNIGITVKVCLEENHHYHQL